MCAVGNCCHSAYCYACHAFLLMGDIPDLNINIRYDEVRDRNGKWLSIKVKEAFHQRLSENNRWYSDEQKQKVNQTNRAAEMILKKSAYDFMKDLIICLREEKAAVSYPIVDARYSVQKFYKGRDFEMLKWVISDIPTIKTSDGEQIIIKAGLKCNDKSEGNEIWIDGIIVDDCWYAASIVFDETWIKKNRMVGWNDYTEDIPNEVWGIVPYGNSRTLVVQSNRWGGKMEIHWSGKVETISTYKDEDNSVLFFPL